MFDGLWMLRLLEYGHRAGGYIFQELKTFDSIVQIVQGNRLYAMKGTASFDPTIKQSLLQGHFSVSACFAVKGVASTWT